MAAVTGQPAPAGVVSSSHYLSFSNHTVHVSVVTIARIKDSRRWSRHRQRARTLTLSALVEANKRTLPSVNEGNNSSSNYEAIQSAAGAAGAGGDSLLTVAKSRNRSLADDMQAEAKAMARAASASIYSPELLATNYGSRPIMVETDVFILPSTFFFIFLLIFISLG